MSVKKPAKKTPSKKAAAGKPPPGEIPAAVISGQNKRLIVWNLRENLHQVYGSFEEVVAPMSERMTCRLIEIFFRPLEYAPVESRLTSTNFQEG